MHLRALVATVDGRQVIEAEQSAPLADFEQLAIDVVAKLKSQGAEALLNQTV
jgi:porphobilinogen deaminase